MLKSQRQTKLSTDKPSNTFRNRQASSEKPQRIHVESSHRILVRCKLRCYSAFSFSGPSGIFNQIWASKNKLRSEVEKEWTSNIGEQDIQSERSNLSVGRKHHSWRGSLY